MKITHYIILLATVSSYSFSIGLPYNRKSEPFLILQDQAQTGSEQDKVYSPEEVDTHPKVKNWKEIDLGNFGPSSDCPDKASVALSVVLRKSGKVTDIEVIKKASCSIDEKALKAANIIKFTPAIKDGVAVSVAVVVEFTFRKY